MREFAGCARAGDPSMHHTCLSDWHWRYRSSRDGLWRKRTRVRHRRDPEGARKQIGEDTNKLTGGVSFFPTLSKTTH